VPGASSSADAASAAAEVQAAPTTQAGVDANSPETGIFLPGSSVSWGPDGIVVVQREVKGSELPAGMIDLYSRVISTTTFVPCAEKVAVPGEAQAKPEPSPDIDLDDCSRERRCPDSASEKNVRAVPLSGPQLVNDHRMVYPVCRGDFAWDQRNEENMCRTDFSLRSAWNWLGLPPNRFVPEWTCPEVALGNRFDHGVISADEANLFRRVSIVSVLGIEYDGEELSLLARRLELDGVLREPAKQRHAIARIELIQREHESYYLPSSYVTSIGRGRKAYLVSDETMTVSLEHLIILRTQLRLLKFGDIITRGLELINRMDIAGWNRYTDRQVLAQTVRVAACFVQAEHFVAGDRAPQLD